MDEHEQWNDLVPYVLWEYRTTYHEAVNNTPYFLLYGVEPVIPTDLILLPDDVRDSMTEPERLKALIRLRQARQEAQASLKKAQARIRQSTSKRPPTPPYKAEDLVTSLKPQGEGKFAKPYSGPWRMCRMRGVLFLWYM